VFRESTAGRVSFGFSRNPLIEFGGGIPAENAFAKHGLAKTVDTLLEFFVISVDFAI
jgi:hypothetical protein